MTVSNADVRTSVIFTKDAQDFLVAAKLSGTRLKASIEGTGRYTEGSTCTLYTEAPPQLNPDRELASPNFHGWWKDGICVCGEQLFRFTVTEQVHFECRWSW